MIFKKGHIVPRWCQFITKDRKAQHCVVFGCDVDVIRENGVIRVMVLSCDGPMFNVAMSPSRRMSNGTYKKTMAVCWDIQGDFSLISCGDEE